MTEAERSSALDRLAVSREVLRQSVFGLTQEQARFKPTPECWSIEEMVEHLAVAEHGMYRLIKDLHQISSADTTAESAATVARTSDRKKMPLAAPDRVRPGGRYPNLSAALEQFLSNRQRTVEFIQGCQDDLRLRVIQHPAGPVNGWDCLSILIDHPVRHAAQIAELKADPAYPQ